MEQKTVCAKTNPLLQKEEIDLVHQGAKPAPKGDKLRRNVLEMKSGSHDQEHNIYGKQTFERAFLDYGREKYVIGSNQGDPYSIETG